MPEPQNPRTELQKIDAAITAQNNLRGILPDEQIEATLAALSASRNILLAQINQSGGVNLASAGDTTVGGDVVAGDKVDVRAGGDYIAPGGIKMEYSPRQEAAQQIADARRRYLLRLRRVCEALPLSALGGEEGSEDEITLDNVYIDLDTTTPIPITPGPLTKEEKKKLKDLPLPLRDSETRPLTALEAAAQHPRLALLGEPGAGKSTFARKVLAWLASVHLGEANPPPSLPGDLFPVLIVLRDLAPRLAALDLDALPGDRQRETLAAAVRDQAVADLGRLEAADFADGLREALNSGRCLLVLDGLDEVPHDLRGRVRQAANAALGHYRLQRILLTCRVRSYVGEAVLSDFQAHTLAPFDEEKIKSFAVAWYNAQKQLGRVDAAQAKHKADDLSQAALSADLRELSANPMMLTTMAIIHQREIGLPKERVRLYSLAVDVLLRRWQKHKASGATLAAFLADDLRLRAVMERLAYDAHRAGRNEKRAADLLRGDALTLLEKPEYLGSAALAAEFLDYVDQRAGLLVGRGGEPGRPAAYGFPHRTFQEYLAGCYLIGQRDATREFFTRAGEGDFWSLAARLGAEELLYNRRNLNGLLDMAYHLCPAREPASQQHQRALLWAGGIAALAGREAIERDRESPEGGQTYLDRLLARLVALLGSELPAPERAEAGNTLARLG
ncbi:MAG: hypothetical protein HW418_2013, partial [Anaerolineales bacterium]|nr:hypothetical protein [Anaerolineales bacterium]